MEFWLYSIGVYDIFSMAASKGIKIDIPYMLQFNHQN